MSGGRRSARTELLRLGFTDPSAAAEGLAELGTYAHLVAGHLAGVPDPDAALVALLDLADRVEDRDELLSAVTDDVDTGARLLAVLGGSEALVDHLRRHPGDWRQLADPALATSRGAAWAMREELLRAVGADPAADAPTSGLPDAEAVDALRVAYRRILLRLAARDLVHGVGVDDVAAELSDLAAGTLDAALAVARARLGEDADLVRLAVVALGKCGAHELNYVSDVDVVFVCEPVDGADHDQAMRAGGRLAANLMQVCSDDTAEGTIWPVDANLRPEGRHGPLVRTLDSHRGYYERWAKTWEFQALLKARAVAGDLDLGHAYVEMTAPLVWSVADREEFVEDVRAMRRRVLEHIPTSQAQRQLKLGSGGLRDVEFAVQLLQLVHGRDDTGIRSPTTLSALAQLTRAGYVGRPDGQALHEAYAFLRRLEHRLQLHRLTRTQVVPADEPALRRLGRAMGHLRDPVAGLEEEWRHHRREVRRLHEKLFYRPLLNAVARLPGEEARLSTDAAAERLTALGYLDPRGALRHIEALTAGVSRTARIQRTLLPVMLEWFADAPDPDAGLFGFRRISESLGRTPWYLKTLRDEGLVAERLARLLASSRYATDLLEREPEGVRLLGTDLTPLSHEALRREMQAAAARQPDTEAAIRAVRGIRRRELLRTSMADLFHVVEVEEIGFTLCRITDATLDAALAIAVLAVQRDRSLPEAPARLAIIAMGRYGGFELSYGSDADVMFVHEPLEGTEPSVATSYAQAVANELRRLLALPASDPALEVDADLRPEGRQGPLVRSLESYAAYYEKWSQVWETQALLRANAVVGDIGLRERFTELIDPLRFPEDGIGEDAVIEIRRIKARVDEERLPRGADHQTHLKLGRGGLADIEWTVQLLQLRHAGQVPGLRTTSTLRALEAAEEAGLIEPDDAADLRRAWCLVSDLRNAATQVRGKPADQLPRDSRERAAVASLLGYDAGQTEEMFNDYLRTTRHARGVVDRIFWE